MSHSHSTNEPAPLTRHFRTGTILFTLVVGAISANAQSMRALSNSSLQVLQDSNVVGTPSGSEVLHLAVSLAPQNQAAFEAFCDSVSDPKSPNYMKFITPQEVGERFGASSTQVANVASYLKSKGMKVTLTSPNRMVILADATVTQAQNAFKTQLKLFKGPDPFGNGQITFRANATPVSVPTNLASTVINVSGLENYTRHAPRANTQTLTPTLTRALYNTKPMFTALFRGQGRTIGISNFDGFLISDAIQFINQFGLPVPAGGAGSNIQVITIDGGNQGGGPGGEGSLDLQAVLATAPLAKIIEYDGGSGIVTCLAREASDNTCDIITESYGWNISGSTLTAAHNQRLAMTAQGITYMCASGDAGTNFLGFDYPNYDPEVMMVGGTVATVNDATGARVSEVGWDGSGGGWSLVAASFNALPSWQVGNGVPTGINKRLVPDVSLHADGAGGGYLIVVGGSTIGISGTSASSPTFAGCLAIAEQKLISLGALPTIGGKLRLGRLMDLIYQQNGRSDVYLDITTGNNGTLPNGNPSTGKPGWDFVTGWGAVDFNGFVNAFIETVTPTTVPANTITTLQGTHLLGDLSSVTASDNGYYTIESIMIDKTGNPVSGNAVPTAQVTSAQLDFHIDISGGLPTNLSIQVEANVSVRGATDQIFGWNWNTGKWELIGSLALDSVDTTKSLTIQTSAFSKFIDGSGNVRTIVKTTMPVRVGRPVRVPPQYIYALDNIELHALFSD